MILGKSVDEAMEWNNEVEQGLSSSLFTQNIGNIFKVLWKIGVYRVIQRKLKFLKSDPYLRKLL